MNRLAAVAAAIALGVGRAAGIAACGGDSTTTVTTTGGAAAPTSDHLELDHELLVEHHTTTTTTSTSTDDNGERRAPATRARDVRGAALRARRPRSGRASEYTRRPCRPPSDAPVARARSSPRT